MEDHQLIATRTVNSLLDTLKKEVGDYFSSGHISDEVKLNLICMILVSFFSTVFSIFVLIPLNDLNIKKKNCDKILQILFSKVRNIIDREIKSKM